MGKFNWFWAILALSFTFSSCAKDDLSNEQDGGSDDVTPAANLIVMTYDKFVDKDDVKIISDDTTKISVSKAFIEANKINVEVGDEPVPLVVWKSMNSVPFVRNVTKTEVKGDKIELTTEYGDMGDVFPDTEFNLETDLHVNPTQSRTILTRAGEEIVNPNRYMDEEGDYHPAVYIIHEEMSYIGENGELVKSRADEAKCFTAEDLFADNADFDILNVDKTIKDVEIPIINENNIKVNLYAKNNYIKAITSLKVNVKTKFFCKLKKFECVSSGNFAGRTTLGVSASANYSKDIDKRLVTLSKCTSVFWVGVVPVAVTTESGLDIFGKLDLKGSCDVSSKFDFTSQFEAGAVYEGGWRTVATGKSSNNIGFNLNTEMELNAKTDLTAALRANVLLYDCVGPEIIVGPNVKADFNTVLKSEVVGSSSNNYLAGNYNAKLSYGGSVDAIVKIWKWEIARWSSPFTIWNGPQKSGDFRIDF